MLTKGIKKDFVRFEVDGRRGWVSKGESEIKKERERMVRCRQERCEVGSKKGRSRVVRYRKGDVSWKVKEGVMR